jgi:hypothetical protein
MLTAAGFIGLAFVYLRKRPPISWLLLAAALLGCSLATAHGIYGIVNRALQVTGALEVESAPFDVDQHQYVLWDLVLFEPWFTIAGLLFANVGWQYIDGPRNKRLWLVLCTLGIFVGLSTALLGVRFA